MKMFKREFNSESQWKQHQSILTMGCRVRSFIPVTSAGSFLVEYKRSMPVDTRFMVLYYAEGGSRLYLESDSEDIVSTLNQIFHDQASDILINVAKAMEVKNAVSANN